MRPDDHPDSDSALATEERPKTERPRRFKVLLHNDDFTTMEFVVEVLVEHFHKSPAEATQIMPTCTTRASASPASIRARPPRRRWPR
jgi:ATP-dependent Clp protease adaptor protein ClpS